MAQIWFLCLLQVKLVKNGTISQGTMKYTKKLSLKKSHEELYQILISNTMTSIYVHCTVYPTFHNPWEKGIGQGCVGLHGRLWRAAGFPT